MRKAVGMLLEESNLRTIATNNMYKVVFFKLGLP